MLSTSRAPLCKASRINQAADGGNAIGGDAGFAEVLPDSLLVRRQVNAINLVFRDITMQPLNLRSHLVQGLQRLERDLPDLRLGERPSARNLAFNHELRHYRTSVQQPAARSGSHPTFQCRVKIIHAGAEVTLLSWLSSILLGVAS